MDNNDFNNSFEPQLPFTDNNIHTSSEPNTKQYSNADYNHQTQKQSEPAYRQYQQQPNTAHHTDYSQASYYNASQSQRPNMNYQGFNPPPYAVRFESADRISSIMRLRLISSIRILYSHQTEVFRTLHTSRIIRHSLKIK